MMNAKNMWSVLGIEPTTSKRDIKKAYAAAIKNCYPEEHPEEYEELKAAYEAALKWTEQNVKAQDIDAVVPKDFVLSQEAEKILPEEDTEEVFPEETPEFLDKLEQFQEKKELSALGRKVLDAFIQDFTDDRKRKAKEQWQEFFLQDDFLRVQFEETFVEKLNEYLQEQQLENYYDLPMTLIIELVIAYGLVLEADGSIYTYSTWDGEYETLEPCANIIAGIWNAQSGPYSRMKGSSFLKKAENKARLDSFVDYHQLRYMAEHGFLVEERWMEWDKIIFASREGNLQLKDNSKVFTDYVPKRHECLLDLYGFLFENYDIPLGACKDMYKTCELHNTDRKALTPKYIRIKNAILKQCPELSDIDLAHLHAEDYLRVTRKLLNIEQKYCYYDWIKTPDNDFIKLCLIGRKKNVPIRSDKEWTAVEKLLKSEDFLKVAQEAGFCEKLSGLELSYCSAIQLYHFYKDREVGKAFVKSLFRKLEEYLLINECLVDASEEELVILQGMKEEVLAIFEEMGMESKELTLEAYDREACGFSVHLAEDFQKCERVDVSTLTDEQKAAKLLEVMKANRENASVTLPHLEDLYDYTERYGDAVEERSEVEKKFAEQYGYINNNYVFLKYGTREAEITEKLVAMGLIENQENLYEIVGEFHVEDFAFNRKTSSVVRKAKDTTYAVGWYWTTSNTMVPIMQGESQNFYGTRDMNAKIIESFEKYLVHVLCLEYVTQIIVCTGNITIDCDVY